MLLTEVEMFLDETLPKLDDLDWQALNSFNTTAKAGQRHHVTMAAMAIQSMMPRVPVTREALERFRDDPSLT